MKKLIIVTVIAIIGVSCSSILPIKPYVVFDKEQYKDGICRFSIFSQNGCTMFSEDSCHFYKIGDTIK